MMSLISISLFQLIFLFFLINYNSDSAIIIVTGQDISYEYWNWWLSLQKNYTSQTVVALNGISKIFWGLFGFEYLLLLLVNQKKPHVFVVSVQRLLLACVLLIGWRYYCIPNLQHYRLFMKLVPTETLSLIFLFMVLVDFQTTDQVKK